jgi:hypothetical protein
MKRRGRRDAAINLFSFQDIMASVIGMVFFVVLILALDIVNARGGGAGDAPPATEADVAALQESIRRLEEDIRRLEQEVARAADRLQLASGDESEMLQEAKRLEATLRNLYGRIRQEQDDATRSQAERRLKEDAHRRRLRETDALNRRLGELKAALAEARSAPSVMYIVDASPGGLAPWLLEVSATGLRVASQDGAGAVVAFGGRTAEDRRGGFLGWLGSQDSSTHYVVLLVKPSGVDLANRLEQDIRDKGFDVGVDLLPETWEPF